MKCPEVFVEMDGSDEGDLNEGRKDSGEWVKVDRDDF